MSETESERFERCKARKLRRLKAKQSSVMLSPNGWKNADKYDELYRESVEKKCIWNYGQNAPEMVVEDVMGTIRCIMSEHDSYMDGNESKEARDELYAILLKRGVNKWLMVRKLLIRLKKVYVLRIHDYQRNMFFHKLGMKETYDTKDWSFFNGHKKKYWYNRGRMAEASRCREELRLLCNSPRWVIFNQREIGVVDTVGMKQGQRSKWVKLFNFLVTTKFKK